MNFLYLGSWIACATCVLPSAAWQTRGRELFEDAQTDAGGRLELGGALRGQVRVHLGAARAPDDLRAGLQCLMAVKTEDVTERPEADAVSDGHRRMVAATKLLHFMRTTGAELPTNM